MVRLPSRGGDLTFMEEKVFWKNGALIGEGLWRKNTGDVGVVICHPHPMMGGSMHNNVVETVQDVFSSCGYTTLRFNFRGVGESSGVYDEGRGEKQDILSACEFMKYRGVEKITLAGYSFGAWVCCCLLQDKPSFIRSTILISPAQSYFDYDWAGLDGNVEYIICGEEDEFGHADNLRKNAKQIHAKLAVLQATDHFYFGREGQLAEYLREYIIEKKA
jgi:uncharacterized protein